MFDFAENQTTPQKCDDDNGEGQGYGKLTIITQSCAEQSQTMTI